METLDGHFVRDKTRQDKEAEEEEDEVNLKQGCRCR